MNCDPAELASLSRCYCFGSKWRSVLAYIYCQWANNLTPPVVPFSWVPATNAITWTDTNGTFAGDVATFQATADIGSVTFIQFPPAVTSFEGASSLPMLDTFVQVNGGLIQADLSNCANLTVLAVYGGNVLTSVNIAGCVSLSTIRTSGNPPFSALLGFADCILLDDINMFFCDLPVLTVNSLLSQLVANGITGGTVKLNGGTNAAPTVGPPDGIAAATALLAEVPAWSVTTN